MPVESVQFEDFELDRSACELRRGGSVVHLERIPFDLLNLLIDRHGELVTRQEILERIWGKDVYVDADNSINTAVRKIRQALQDNPEAPRFVVTVPARGYRFVAPVERVTAAAHNGAGREVAAAIAAATEAHAVSLAGATNSRETARRYGRAALLGAVIAAIVAEAVLIHFRRSPALTAKDTIVVADFANTTGETVFNDTLKQALSVQLEQSPFLNILSDKRMSETLQMMGQPAGQAVSEKTGLEICQRTRSAAVLAGTIAKLGSEYVIGLNAVNCRTGDFLAKEQVRVGTREMVLKGVDGEAKKIRERLGESLSSIQKFDTPIEEATTGSLEALQAYSVGCRKLLNGDDVGAVTFLQRAAALDPNFAMAYARLGAAYSNLWELNLAGENTGRAYALREKVSERERFYIDSHYHMFVSGSVEKGRQTFELWAQVYPRDEIPVFNLGELYSNIGQYDIALAEAQEALRLEPESALNYATLVYRYLELNRLKEAQALIAEAQAKKMDSASLHFDRYQVAFLQNDQAGMAKEEAWAAGRPGVDDRFLSLEASTAAYFGRIKKARELSRRAEVSAEEAEEKETAIGCVAQEMVRAALVGNFAEARSLAAKVRGQKTGEDAEFAAAFTSALSGETATAQALADAIAKRFPEDTFVQFTYEPMIRAELLMIHHDPAGALAALQAAAPYEMGDLTYVRMYPVYVRGEAYLAAYEGRNAATEFQKIIDHREITNSEMIGALARLQLGRARALAGNKIEARAAYQSFLALWKDADPDIPILHAAKAEYARLQ